jgi:hypothetical protein
METAYTALKSQGSSAGMALLLMSFDGLTTLMGFPEVHDFERRWAERAAASYPAELARLKSGTRRAGRRHRWHDGSADTDFLS